MKKEDEDMVIEDKKNTVNKVNFKIQKLFGSISFVKP